MRRRLLLLNLLLAGMAALFAWTLRQHWQEARAHEHAVLSTRVPPAPAPSLPPAPTTPPVFADRYADVAEKMLFARDRNPTVILDPTPPPREKPVPPFPVAHGVMIWPGVPPSIILTQKGKSEQRSYQVGDKIGEFSITGITDEKIVFEWDGKKFEKNISDLIDNSAPVQTASAPPPPPPSENNSQSLGETSHPNAASGPGTQISETERACTASDSSPAGAVVDGYRKQVMVTPMGKSCGWEKVGQ